MGTTTNYAWNYGTRGQNPWWNEWAAIFSAIDTEMGKKIGPVHDITSYGAVGDGRSVTDAVISLANPTWINSNTAAFTSADVGKIGTVEGAGVAGAVLAFTINSISSSTRAVMSVAASTAVIANGRVSIGTDNSAAYVLAVSAALLSGNPIYAPSGWYHGTWPTITGPVSIIGDKPTFIYLTSTAQDLDMRPLLGTWFDAGNSVGLLGNSMRGSWFENFGIKNFTKMVSFGGDGSEGASLGGMINIYGVGFSQANGSDIGIENYNFEHFKLDNVKIFNVNTGLRLVCQNNYVQPGNSIIDDFYVFTYPKSVANANNTKAGIEVLALTPTTGPSPSSINFLEFIRPQVNSFNGDSTGIGILLQGISGTVVSYCTFLDADVEGLLAYSVKFDYATSNFLRISTAPFPISFSADTSYNTVYSVDATASVVDSSAGTNNIYQGLYATIASKMLGIIRPADSGLLNGYFDIVTALKSVALTKDRPFYFPDSAGWGGGIRFNGGGNESLDIVTVNVASSITLGNGFDLLANQGSHVSPTTYGLQISNNIATVATPFQVGFNSVAASAVTIKGPDSSGVGNAGGDVILTGGTAGAGGQIGHVRITSNEKIGGSALRATTEGTNHLDIFDGTAPVGTLANGGSIYSVAGELYMMDAAGNATLQTPHDEKGEWVFYSKNTVTGKTLKIDMERMMRKLNDMLGGEFIHEFMEEVTP